MDEITDEVNDSLEQEYQRHKRNLVQMVIEFDETDNLQLAPGIVLALKQACECAESPLPELLDLLDDIARNY